MERAEQLLTELIESMPHVPDRIKAVWQMRTEPFTQLVEYSEVRDGEIVKTYAVRYMAGKNKLSESVRFPTAALAAEQAHTAWPNVRLDKKTVVDHVSFHAAKQDLENQRLLKWIEQSGLTPEQIIARIQSGEIKEIKL